MEKAFVIYPGWLGKRRSEELVAFGEERDLEQAPIADAMGNAVYASTREAKIRLLPPFDDRALNLDRMLMVLMRKANASFGFDVTHILGMQYTSYGIGGLHDWHDDLLWFEGVQEQRKITLVIQLSDSDDYEGGDFQIRPKFGTPPDATMLRRQGTAFLFPAITEHRVTPITRGQRRSLAVFYGGPLR